MSELVAVSFDNVDEADHVLNELTQLEKEHLVDLEDAVVVIRRADGKVFLKQSYNLVGQGAAYGGLSGAAWGTLVGLLFLNPLIGFAVGGLAGAGAGALSGAVVDYGLDDKFVRSVGETLAPATSALFVLVRKAQPEKVIAELSKFKGTIIKSSLSPADEKRLQEAIARPETSGAPSPA